MKLYIKGGKIVATHADEQNIPASFYGTGVKIVDQSEGGAASDGTVEESGDISIVSTILDKTYRQNSE